MNQNESQGEKEPIKPWQQRLGKGAPYEHHRFAMMDEIEELRAYVAADIASRAALKAQPAPTEAQGNRLLELFKHTVGSLALHDQAEAERIGKLYRDAQPSGNTGELAKKLANRVDCDSDLVNSSNNSSSSQSSGNSGELAQGNAAQILDPFGAFAKFKSWADDNLGQGYSLAMEDHTFIDPVTRWAFAGYRAGLQAVQGEDSARLDALHVYGYVRGRELVLLDDVKKMMGIPQPQEQS